MKGKFSRLLNKLNNFSDYQPISRDPDEKRPEYSVFRRKKSKGMYDKPGEWESVSGSELMYSDRADKMRYDQQKSHPDYEYKIKRDKDLIDNIYN